MFCFRNEVSHEWERRHLLARLRAREVSRESVCDADFLLLAAARYHGEPKGMPCPVCGRDGLRSVKWVHGEKLGRRSGTARDDREIERLVAQVGPLTVHEVEVCPQCHWNHLNRALTAVCC